MTDRSQALAALLDSARRRHLSQVIVEQAAVASGAAFAGAVLLLLAGTQILDWYWPIILFLASFGAGLWRTLRRIPSRYRLAQLVDARLNLHDTLSTAFIFQSSQRKVEPELLAYQTGQAAAMASRVDASRVFPMRIPKALYAAAGIALVAFGMFAIRYGVTRSLDLRPSLVKIAFDTFWKQQTAPGAKTALQRTVEDQLKKLGVAVSVPDAQAKPRDEFQTSALETVDGPDVRNAEAGDNARAKVETTAKDEQPGDADNSEKGERAAGNEDQNPSGDQPPDTAQAAGNQKNQPKDEKSSMMDRMRDAMANLLNKLKMQPKGGESRQRTAQDSKSGSRGQESQKGSPTPGKPQSNGAESQNQQGEQKQGQGERAQNAQGKTGDKGANREPSNDSKSGIGKDDGDKSAREAEQLAAMGKISEILGKRAQNMSGELMVEVSGGNQSLKTAYSGTAGKHAEAGGEINRDEVPLIYRDFVQQYFEQIRKEPAPPAGKKPAKAGA